jgi:hypothetical protein
MLRSLSPNEWQTQIEDFLQKAAEAQEIESLPPLKDGIYIEEAESWEDFLRWQSPLVDNYVFRGQSRAAWPLHSSIDRLFGVREATAAPQSSEPKDSESQAIVNTLSVLSEATKYSPGAFALNAERRMVFKFQQRAHEFLRHLPEKEDLVSWLALMQHHGAPTRLLDWTTSSYVAAFFAFEEVTDVAAIWAIDNQWLAICRSLAADKLQLWKSGASQADNLNRLNRLLLIDDGAERPYLIVEAEPVRNDTRMTSQCGIFLVKCRTDATFDELLTMMLVQVKRSLSTIPRPPIRKLEIAGSCRKDFLRNLRHVNVHQGTLFPGLDGFARSLKIDCELDHGWEASSRQSYYRNLV